MDNGVGRSNWSHEGVKTFNSFNRDSFNSAPVTTQGNPNYPESLTISPPRKGIVVCFGFGGLLSLCENSHSKLLCICKVLENKKEFLNFQNDLGLGASLKFSKDRFSQTEISKINSFFESAKQEVNLNINPMEYLTKFRTSCFFELVSLSLNRGYIVNNPSDFDSLFSGIRSPIELGIWRCCCEANGKPIEFISKRSLLGFYCGTFGVSKTLEICRESMSKGNAGLELEIQWSDRFALSGFCGERELSSCYFDFAKSPMEEFKEERGVKCECYEGIIKVMYLSIAQKADCIEVSDKVILELWPHYIYSVISGLGVSHTGSRSLLSYVSSKLLSDVKNPISNLTLSEKIFGWQFCMSLLGDFRKIPCGVNSSILETYIVCMDIIARLLHSRSPGNISSIPNEDFLLQGYLYSIYYTEVGNFERAESYIEHVYPYLVKGGSKPSGNISKEYEFLRIRIRERNMNLKTGTSRINHIIERQQPQDQLDSNTRNSSWLVGWISGNIKKAMGAEEERWPGVENTFYFDKDINQWCQRGPDGKRIPNETPHTDSNPASSTGNGQLGSGNSKPGSLPPPPKSLLATNKTPSSLGAITSGGVRSRYVDIFQREK
ncbi:hypothetical protein HWI79_3563 [Cryptosporidium felis]|nr:hypothetical protein HWI79_3563 [Cryptosporidium felis]